MEPTLHCAKPAPGCLGDERDLVYAVPYGNGASPRRGDIVVFEPPPAAALRCGAGGVFIKRVVGLPGERWRERGGRIRIDREALAEPWLRPGRRDSLSFPGGAFRLVGTCCSAITVPPRATRGSTASSRW